MPPAIVTRAVVPWEERHLEAGSSSRTSGSTYHLVQINIGFSGDTKGMAKVADDEDLGSSMT